MRIFRTLILILPLWIPNLTFGQSSTSRLWIQPELIFKNFDSFDNKKSDWDRAPHFTEIIGASVSLVDSTSLKGIEASVSNFYRWYNYDDVQYSGELLRRQFRVFSIEGMLPIIKNKQIQSHILVGLNYRSGDDSYHDTLYTWEAHTFGHKYRDFGVSAGLKTSVLFINTRFVLSTKIQFYHYIFLKDRYIPDPMLLNQNIVDPGAPKNMMSLSLGIGYRFGLLKGR